MKKIMTLLLALLAHVVVLAQWNSDPLVNTRLTAENEVVYDWQFKVNKDGVTFLHFKKPSSNGISTYLQIIDKDGKCLFPAEGKLIASQRTITYTVVNELAMVDSDGNALFAVSDSRNSDSDLMDMSFTIYKISPTGEMLWGEEGIDLELGHSSYLEACMKMIQLEDGSYMFAWMKSLGDLMSIQVERLANNGDFLWDKETLVLKDDARTNAYPYLVNAGNNQALLIYARGSNQDIMARKIDFDGSAVWSEDLRIYRGGFPDIPLHTLLKVIPDSKGGAFVAWHDDRAFTGIESVYASYITPEGKLAFPAGVEGQEIGITDEFRSFFPEMYYDKKGDFLYVLWRETLNNTSFFQRLMIQKVAMTGELMWGPEGIELLPADKERPIGYYDIKPAEDGKLAVFYMEQARYNDVTGSVIKIDMEDGSFAWEDKAKVFASSQTEKGSLKVSPVVNGEYWLTMWTGNPEPTNDEPEEGKEEEETQVKGGIFMQRVNLDGSLGTMGTAITQNVADQDMSLSYNNEKHQFRVNNLQNEQVELSLYSLLGQKLAIVYKGRIDADTQYIDGNVSSQLSAGIYVATLVTSGKTEAIRIVID